jgi:hypothetical protein
MGRECLFGELLDSETGVFPKVSDRVDSERAGCYGAAAREKFEYVQLEASADQDFPGNSAPLGRMGRIRCAR